MNSLVIAFSNSFNQELENNKKDPNLKNWA
jgi:hypothetical protein